MKCGRCGKNFPEEELRTVNSVPFCEDCFIHKGLFPLGHRGPLGKLFNIKDNRPIIKPMETAGDKKTD